MKAHYDALKARIELAPTLTGKVDSSVRIKVPGEVVRDNYVVLWPTGPDDLGDGRFTGVQRAQSRARYRYDVRAVAVDANGCMLLAQAILDQTVGHTLTVDGRACRPCRLDECGRVQHDKTVNLYFQDLVIEVLSEPF